MKFNSSGIRGKCWMASLLFVALITLFSVRELLAASLGNIESFTWNATDKRIDISCGTPKVRIIYYKDDIFRVWVSSSSGSFSDAASTDLVVWKGTPIIPTIDSTTSATYYLIKTTECALRVYKAPCKLGLFDISNTTAAFEESSPINLGSSTVQTLTRKTDEHFYGCGAWNGHFSLTNLSAPAKYVQNYENGGSPNPAPFYVSRMGYGAFRNTWDFKQGVYSFNATVTTSHAEDRFDCYYFYGPSLKKVLRGYTDITGKINFPAIWALELGVAGYFTSASSAFGLATTNAAKFASYDIPFGWWFPNDSYDAQLAGVQPLVPALKAMNEWTGAWCGSVFATPETRRKCVQDWGIRGFKLDCSWIGAGGPTAFNGLKMCGPDGIEALSGTDDARSYQWTTAGWAGTQRFSHAWTGDQSSSMEWIRWNVVTGNGGAMSAMQSVTSDLDAIFDGSEAEAKGSTTYVRTWQWQMWMPFLYLMDGWAPPKHRLPWNRCPTYIDPTLKPSMKLKTRLTPYFYTLLADAYETGVSANRPPLLEFPEDRTTWDEGTSSDTKCKQEYMLGPWLLIRPVFEKVTTNASQITMWLPGNENWIQYYTGQIATGAQNVQCEVGLAPDNYDGSKPPAIPVWVREGAIIPMWPAQYWTNNVLVRPNSLGNTLQNTTTEVKGAWTLDVYPHRTKVTSFSMYEDDCLTKQYRTGKSARTMLTSDATKGNGRFIVNIGATVGDYTGKPANKIYVVTLHTGIISPNMKPKGVMINGTLVSEKTDSAALIGSTDGWWFNTIKSGIVYVKTQNIATSTAVEVIVDLVGTGINTVSDITTRDILNKFSVVSNAGKLNLSFANVFTGSMNAAIYNMQGKLIIGKVINVVKSRTELMNAPASGSYILKLDYKGKTVYRMFAARK